MNLQPLGILDFVALVTNTRKNHKHKEKSPSKPQTQIHKPTNPQTHNPPPTPQLPRHGILYLPIANHPTLLP